MMLKLWLLWIALGLLGLKTVYSAKRSNYDQWTHLKGTKATHNVGPYELSFVEGEYHVDNQPLQRWGPMSILFNETIVVNGGDAVGRSNHVWQYSVQFNQWRRIKEALSGTDMPGTLNQFGTNNTIGQRKGFPCAFPIDDHQILVYGGKENVGGLFNDEKWIFSFEKRQWKRIDDFIGNNEGNGVDKTGGRYLFGSENIRNEFGLVMSGWGWHISASPASLDDIWKIDFSTLNFTLLKDFGVDSLAEFGATDVYNSSNTPGAMYSFSTQFYPAKSEVWRIGGWSFNSVGEVNQLWCLNISSWEWRFVSGNKSSPFYPVYGITNRFDENNVMGARRNHNSVLFECQILVLGGNGFDMTNSAVSWLNDVFIFDIDRRLWKFRSRDSTKFRDRSPLYGVTAEYSSENTIGGLEFFEMHLVSNSEIIVAMGLGFGEIGTGYLGDVWQLDIGSRCFGVSDSNEGVCSGNGECVDFDCQCQSGFYENDCSISKCFGVFSNSSSVEICSGLGLCVDGSCLCYASSAYTLDDCSIDEGRKFFDEIFPVFVVVVSVIVVACIIGLILAVVSLVVICALCKRVKKFSELDDVDLLLEEQRAERDAATPKHRINKSLFEVDPKSIKVLGKLGQGGGGAVVYRGEWNNQIIAYKCFLANDFLEEDKYKEFEKELEILSSISFPYILTFYGATLSESRLGILMEYCSNGDLSVYLQGRKETYSKKEKSRLLFEIASAMSFLHGKKIIHRDLKPENVLVTEQERCKVMDFGLSKFHVEGKTKTKKVGTSIYMAPEVWSGNYSYSCDVFSFAILCYVVLTENWYPYGTKLIGIESRIAMDKNLRPSFVGFDICDDLTKLMKKNWSHDSKERMEFETILIFLSKLLGRIDRKEDKLALSRSSGSELLLERNSELEKRNKELERINGEQKRVIEKQKRLLERQKPKSKE